MSGRPTGRVLPLVQLEQQLDLLWVDAIGREQPLQPLQILELRTLVISTAAGRVPQDRVRLPDLGGSVHSR